MKTLSRSIQSTTAELEAAQRAAIAAIDARAGAARSLYITVVPGQEGTYLVKRAEAAEIIAGGQEPADLTPYPHIAKRMGSVDGTTALEVAATVLAMSDAWMAVGAEIDDARLRAKEAVRAATDQAAIDAALTALEARLAPVEHAAPEDP